ncbi:MAG: hypothetical protein JOY79_00520 [Acidobacteriaceae bacterium]|nr:hypothetical protein [Acidobacteriaceae bacterium]
MTVRKPFVVNSGRNTLTPAERDFRPGEAVPLSGIYVAHHERHRLSHQVTLLDELPFPTCSTCGQEVRFELLYAAPNLARDSGFKVRLYQLPHVIHNEGEMAS